MRIAICEDESYWLNTLQDAISTWAVSRNEAMHIECFTDPFSLLTGLECVSDDTYDLLFLDIAFNETDMDGMEVASCLRNMGRMIPIVFVTANALRADEGYLVEAMGYLTKPIDEGKLTIYLDRALSRIHPARIIEINTQSGITLIPAGDIVYAEVIDKQIVCHTRNQTLSFRSTISQFLEQLGTEDFMQVHRSFLIAKDKICGVKPSYPYRVILAKGDAMTEVPISIKYVASVLSVYSNNVLGRMV